MRSLQNFALPRQVTGSTKDVMLGKAIITAWRTDGIFEVSLTTLQRADAHRAIESSKHFFRRPLEEKQNYVSDLSYSGYVACLEERTANKADYSEIFTVCKDIPLNDVRVREQWPCHGPVPWPDAEYRQNMLAFMNRIGGDLGEKLLKLAALGLGLHMNAFTQLTVDGWHHMRVLRFQAATSESARGIGAHTDYGLLVIAIQRGADGLDIRPPVNAEGVREHRKKNWLPGQSTAGEYEVDPFWLRVPLTPDVATVFPGDLMQYITGDHLISTPHKVMLHHELERFAIAYFHEPNFSYSVRPLLGENEPESFFYGQHFTDMFKRCYPSRSTTQRIERLHLDSVLGHIRTVGAMRAQMRKAIR